MSTWMRSMLGLAGMLALSSPALAQEVGAPAATPPEEAAPAAEEEEDVTTPVEPAPAPVVAAQTTVAPEESGPRPTAVTMGIGFGWTFDPEQDLQIPNTVSARFKIMPALTLEPAVVLALSGTSTPNGDEKDKTNQFTLSLAANARYALYSRSKFDFVAIGSPWIAFDSLNTNPAGADNSTTTNVFTVGIDWGLGIEYFVRPHWSISFDATNPFFSFSTQSYEPPAGDSQTTTSYLIGAIFDPRVRAMVHLYF